jgi:prephenate dehydrogenase
MFILGFFQVETSIAKRETRCVRWKRITLAGVGLLGGSLGLALRERRLADCVTGYVRRAASVRECEQIGAVHLATRDLRGSVQDADLIVLCTPIAQMRPLVEQMLPALKPGAIVTDVGSVKANIVRDLESLVEKVGAHFVGSHPMAGAEKMGVAAARADLFLNAVSIITPTRKTNKTAAARIAGLWKSVGARVLRLTPERHDELVSRSSHLPHVVAATLANLVLDPKWPEQQTELCANGFRDTTRVASGSPEMWRDIAMANGKHLGRAVDLFIRDLEKVQRFIAKGDLPALNAFLLQAKSRRDHWRDKGARTSPE